MSGLNHGPAKAASEKLRRFESCSLRQAEGWTNGKVTSPENWRDRRKAAPGVRVPPLPPTIQPG